jgi:hypothetical protein
LGLGALGYFPFFFIYFDDACDDGNDNFLAFSLHSLHFVVDTNRTILPGGLRAFGELEALFFFLSTAQNTHGQRN